ncbi:MAG: SDR family NAD(P)-dependent oxidoreductase [Candidatus Limnocylindria bacterium]
MVTTVVGVFGLSGHTVVVTGASGNLGHTVVRRYLEAGARVVAAVREVTKGTELREALGPTADGPEGTRLRLVEADPADAAAMSRLVEETMGAWGRIDVLANLAGGFASAPATDIEAIGRSWEANVLTTVTATAACIGPMRSRGYGRVVSVSAMGAAKGGKGNAGYSMSKGAVVRWTEALAAEVREAGITVNCVMPGSIDHPKNRERMPKADPQKWATPEEVAAVILFLSSEQASGVTGAAIPITARS